MQTDDATTVSTPQLVEAYIAQRNAIQEREEAHKVEIEAMRAELDAISEQLLAICNTQNADSIKTPAGTVSRRVQSRYWASDWESLYEFILEHDAPFLLERRIHNGNMKQFLDDNPNVHPIGLQLDSKYVIQVRKPTAR